MRPNYVTVGKVVEPFKESDPIKVTLQTTKDNIHVNTIYDIPKANVPADIFYS